MEEIAAALAISLYTVRDHLKVIFAKTATCRQSQLVALLAPTVAALRQSSGGRDARGDGDSLKPSALTR